MTNVMIEIETVNSTYHVDPDRKMVRRSEPIPGESHRLADGEWHPYAEYRSHYGDRLVFDWGDGKATITAPVVSEKEIAA